MFMFLHFS